MLDVITAVTAKPIAACLRLKILLIGNSFLNAGLREKLVMLA
ncbi:hypothetical protein [Candidatus Burkholderia verschuerenii]|nr:hypothetical protein [Candidatus Burkholderia verschuerenii]